MPNKNEYNNYNINLKNTVRFIIFVSIKYIKHIECACPIIIWSKGSGVPMKLENMARNEVLINGLAQNN